MPHRSPSSRLLALLLLVSLPLVSASARTYGEVEDEIIRVMRDHLAAEDELVPLRRDAAALSNIVEEEKSEDASWLDRFLLPRHLEELHGILERLDALEARASADLDRIAELRSEALEILGPRPGGAIADRLDLVSGERMRRTGAALEEARRRGEDAERIRAFEADAAAAEREFNDYYGR